MQFLQWLDQIGARIAGVALTDFVEGRPIFSVGTCAQDGVECFRGVVATQDITAGSTVVSVPVNRPSILLCFLYVIPRRDTFL